MNIFLFQQYCIRCDLRHYSIKLAVLELSSLEKDKAENSTLIVQKREEIERLKGNFSKHTVVATILLLFGYEYEYMSI